MAFFDKTVIKNYLFEQPHNWMAETYYQTYSNLAAILDIILSKYDPRLPSKRFYIKEYNKHGCQILLNFAIKSENKPLLSKWPANYAMATNQIEIFAPNYYIR